MKIILEKDTDLKALETKINKHLADLDAEGNNIKGITYSTDVVPAMRGRENHRIQNNLFCYDCIRPVYRGVGHGRNDTGKSF